MPGSLPSRRQMPAGIFGVLVSEDIKSPDALATAALRRDLPGRFPEYWFEFVRPSEMKLLGEEPEMFRVLGVAITNESGEEVTAFPGPELVEKVQSAVDDIVRRAKRRGLN